MCVCVRESVCVSVSVCECGVCVCEREREIERKTWAWIYAVRRNGTDNASVNLTCEVFQIVTDVVITCAEEDLK